MNMSNDKKIEVDVAIVGGGPAGLSAALVLGRARRTVALIDEGRPRNAVTGEMHGFLSRDGIDPREFRRIALQQISVYPGVQFVKDTAVSIEGIDGHFLLTAAQGQQIHCKKLLFAVGVKDRPLPIPGLAEVYGKSAFVCPYCDGWELRDQPLVLIRRGDELMRFAPVLAGWSNSIVVCTNGQDGLDDARREQLRRNGMPLYDAPIRAIVSRDCIAEQVELEDGTVIPCRGIFFEPDLVIGAELLRAAGCRFTESSTVEVDMLGKTSVPGMYCAGDAATRMQNAIQAAAMGSLAAVAINSELSAAAWQ